MGHQDACGFRCRKYDNRYYEPQQKPLQMVYFLQMMIMVHGNITGRFTTKGGNKIKTRTS